MSWLLCPVGFTCLHTFPTFNPIDFSRVIETAKERPSCLAEVGCLLMAIPPLSQVEIGLCK